MKKFIALVMTAICLLAVGCSKQEENQVIDVIVPNTPEAVVTPAPTPESAGEEPSRMAVAESFVGGEAAELIAAIGEPISADYASSCLGSI